MSARNVNNVNGNQQRRNRPVKNVQTTSQRSPIASSNSGGRGLHSVVHGAGGALIDTIIDRAGRIHTVVHGGALPGSNTRGGGGGSHRNANLHPTNADLGGAGVNPRSAVGVNQRFSNRSTIHQGMRAPGGAIGAPLHHVDQPTSNPRRPAPGSPGPGGQDQYRGIPGGNQLAAMLLSAATGGGSIAPRTPLPPSTYAGRRDPHAGMIQLADGTWVPNGKRPSRGSWDPVAAFLAALGR